MSEISYNWLTLSNMVAYTQLCAEIDANLKTTGTEAFMDFLTMQQSEAALREGRVMALYVDGQLAATIIAEHCHLGERIGKRFSGDTIDTLDVYGIYLRNGMVGPSYQGRGLYNLLMQHMVAIYDGETVAGTMNVRNIGPQRACASAGLLPNSRLTRIKDGADTMLFTRVPSDAFGVTTQAA